MPSMILNLVQLLHYTAVFRIVSVFAEPSLRYPPRRAGACDGDLTNRRATENHDEMGRSRIGRALMPTDP